MQPLLLGPEEAGLFGVYHAAEGESERGVGVLFCNPFGHEAVLAHRTYRVLATRLARAGFACLRFDYYGTGDSPGEGEEGSVERWISNIQTTTDAFKSLAGLGCVAMVGLRLGATLALLAGCRRDDVPLLALWEPVGGATYVRELRERQRVWLAFEASEGRRVCGGDSEFIGHALPSHLVQGLAQVDLFTVGSLKNRRVLLVGGPDSLDLRRLFEGKGAAVECRDTDEDIWSDNVTLNLARVPSRAVGTIVDWLVSATS